MITHNGYVKVIDFGAAKNISQRDFAKTFIGTTHYMSPAVIKGNKYGYGVDYWAMGVILYEFFYGMLPFGHGETNQYNVYKKIMEKDVVFPSKKFTALNNLIECLLEKNPKNRLMSFRSIQNHDLFNGFDFDELIEGRKAAPFVVNTQLNNSELSYTDIQFQVFIKNRYHFSHSDAEEFHAQNNVAEFLQNF
jgi:serine/threonine protein kinase